jgi:hypothetical protein
MLRNYGTRLLNKQIIISKLFRNKPIIMHKNPQSYIYIDFIPTCLNGHAITFTGYKALQVPKASPEDDGMSIETCRDKVDVNITLWIFVHNCWFVSN